MTFEDFFLSFPSSISDPEEDCGLFLLPFVTEL